MSNLTDTNMKTLNACQCDEDWNTAVKNIKKEHGGYPSDWYARMLATGLMDKITGRFGKAGFAITAFSSGKELADALEGKPTPNAKTEVACLPEHSYDGQTIAMEPVRARLRSIALARPDLPQEVAQICGMYADHMDNADRLVDMGVCMSFVLFVHDLHRGVNGYTRAPMRNPLGGLPGLLFQFVLADVLADIRDSILPSLLPDGMREKVAAKFAEMDAKVAEQSQNKRAAESLVTTLVAAELASDAPKTGG
jgi:hypothetical protein